MTKLGKLLFTLVFLAVVLFGVSKWWNRLAPEKLAKRSATESKEAASDVELATTQTEVPKLVAPGAYTLVVEAAREVGGRELLKIPFTWPAKSPQDGKAQGKTELGAVALSIQP